MASHSAWARLMERSGMRVPVHDPQTLPVLMRTVCAAFPHCSGFAMPSAKTMIRGARCRAIAAITPAHARPQPPPCGILPEPVQLPAAWCTVRIALQVPWTSAQL